MAAAAAPALSLLLTAAEHTSTSTGASTGTLAVALVGALSAVVVALVPELFKALRPQAAPVPPEVVTPGALDAAKEALRAEWRAALVPVAEAATRAEREVRAVRRAAEAQHDRYRDDMERVRDAVQEHRWREHGLQTGLQSPLEPVPLPRPPTDPTPAPLAP